MHSAKITQNEFENQFAKEILQSERTRMILLLIVFGAVLVSLAFMIVFFPDRAQQFFQYSLPLHIPIIVSASIVLYEGVVIVFITKLVMKWNRVIPIVPRYLNAFLETSYPTIAIIIAAHYISLETAIIHPVIPMYFLFIILSALRLDFKLCVFTGLVAALEYSLVMVYYIQQELTQAHDPMFLSYFPHFGKGIIFLLGGVVAGFVTQQIKKRVLQTFQSTQERNQIMNVFGQHVSPEVVNKLLDQKSENLSEERHVCMMFLDIRNFTTFSENRSPSEVVTFLNTLFDFMIDSINNHHGIINKFLGDGFMAVFGAPFSDGEDSANAVRASLEILERIKTHIDDEKIPPTRIGIGLHCGEAVTGHVGSSKRKEYTIIGDVVNLASRIEQLTKQYDATLLISKPVYDSIQSLSIPSEWVGQVQVKGRQQPVDIYKLK
jgi:adenylate cyclase